MNKQADLAKTFFELHYQDSPLVIPNAWDAASALVFSKTGAKAIATSSAGLAACFGYPDGEQIPFDSMLIMIKRMVELVDIPVSVDFESGFATNEQELLDNFDKLLAIGVAGINIEDRWPQETHQLIPLKEQTARIQLIKSYLRSKNRSLFINARTDTYWQKTLNLNDAERETGDRLLAYQSAGADGLFIPGLNDLGTLKKLSEKLKLPINILAHPNLNLKKVREAGASRITLGSLPLRYSLTKLQALSKSLLIDNLFELPNNCFSYDELNSLMLN